MIDLDKLETLTKKEIVAALHEQAATYPQLSEITAEMKKDEILERARSVVDVEAGFAMLVKKNPKAVIVPRTQAIFRLPHPKLKGEFFTLSIFPEGERLGSKLVDRDVVFRRWRTPEDEVVKKERPKPRAYPVTEVPEWAYAQVYKLIQRGDLVLRASADDISDEPVKTGLLDTVTERVSYGLSYGSNTNMHVEHRPITVKAVTRFETPEHEAAWNVMRETVDGEGPLPHPNDVEVDPGLAGTVEVDHVIDRVKSCLEYPDRYTKKPINAGFQERIFFSQLLEIEYKGFTPQRTPAGNAHGGTRPAVIKALRRLARERGFRVIGSYVVNEQDTEIRGQKTPINTVPMVDRS